MKTVLCNILEAKGGNDLVEKKRGKYKNIKLEDVIVQMQKESDDKGDHSQLTYVDVIALQDEDNLEETMFADI